MDQAFRTNLSSLFGANAYDDCLAVKTDNVLFKNYRLFFVCFHIYFVKTTISANTAEVYHSDAATAIGIEIEIGIGIDMENFPRGLTRVPWLPLSVTDPRPIFWGFFVSGSDPRRRPATDSLYPLPASGVRRLVTRKPAPSTSKNFLLIFLEMSRSVFCDIELPILNRYSRSDTQDLRDKPYP